MNKLGQLETGGAVTSANRLRTALAQIAPTCSARIGAGMNYTYGPAVVGIRLHAYPIGRLTASSRRCNVPGSRHKVRIDNYEVNGRTR